MLASLLLVLFFFWLAHYVLDHTPGGRLAGRVVKRFFTFTFLAPARQRGVLFGLWHFLLWLAILSTVALVCAPSEEGVESTLILWAVVIVGILLLTYTPHLSHSRFRRPLPGRQRRNQ